MKNLVLFFGLSLAVMLLTATSAMSQEGIKDRVSVGSGLTISHINGSGYHPTQELGYYVQVRSTGKLGDYMGYGGDFQFIHHHNHDKINGENIAFNVRSLAVSFYYMIYPVKTGPTLSIGFQNAYVVRAKINDYKLDSYTKGNMSFSLEVAQEFDKIIILCRANRYVSDARIFNSMVQVGVNYKLN